MEVKIAEVKDIPEIIKIMRDEIYSDQKLEELKSWFISTSAPYLQHFAALKNGKIIGFISWGLYDMWEDDLILKISWLAIKKRYQRKAAGTELVKESFKKVKEFWERLGKRIIKITVETDQENDQA